MYTARGLLSLCLVLSTSTWCFGQARPTASYVFDRDGTQNDVGSTPAAPAEFFGSAVFAPQSPGMFSCGSLDLTANSAQHNYVSSGTDVQKLDALEDMTVSFWINLQAAPAYNDCIISDMPADYPPAGTGGWEIRIISDGDAPSASNFNISFEVLQAGNGWNNVQSQPSPAINADNRWVFLAVTYSNGMVQRYYMGTETGVVEQIGYTAYYSYPLLDNAAELRIGSATSEPTVDRTPPAWIDDVRIYGRELNQGELDEVRLANLGYSNLQTLPGFTALGGLTGVACGSYAQALSADGSTGIGHLSRDQGQLAFRWKDGIYALLPGLAGGQNATALRCSDDGSLVVGSAQSAEGGTEAVMWDAAGSLTRLGDFPGGQVLSTANGISRDGAVIVGVGVDRADNLTDAFRYVDGTLHKLGYLPGGAQSAAYDVSPDGTTIVGSSESADGWQAFRWRDGAFTPLGDLAGGILESRANKVAANGVMVVGSRQSTAGREAVCWVNRRAFGLGDLPGGPLTSEALGVTAHGSYIVGRSSATGPAGSAVDEAFIWDRVHGMRPLKAVLEQDYGLDLAGWHLAAATGISDNGSVVTGYGVNPAGVSDSFMARIPVPNAVMDLDGDEDIDIDDFEVFAACATGPSVPYGDGNMPAGCDLVPDSLGLIAADLDWDGDVDGEDFAVLQRCLGASGDSPSADCRG